ncbi:MAG: hypothetical protein HC767_00360 [Akkermansiaceae bacterium]|nr:hypothetical protein [Akkermansiaceae bacterium]
MAAFTATSNNISRRSVFGDGQRTSNCSTYVTDAELDAYSDEPESSDVAEAAPEADDSGAHQRFKATLDDDASKEEEVNYCALSTVSFITSGVCPFPLPFRVHTQPASCNLGHMCQCTVCANRCPDGWHMLSAALRLLSVVSDVSK